MTWFFVIWLAFGISTTLFMWQNGYTSHDAYFIAWQSVQMGFLIAIASVAAEFYRELRRLRALKQFIWNWVAALHLQNAVIDELKKEASYVKEASEALIRLQKKGLEAVECVEAGSNFSDEKGITNAFDGVKSRMTQRFNEAQSPGYL